MPPVPNNVRLTDRQRSILRGTLAGDGNLHINIKRREKNAKLQLSHSPSQSEFLEWKFAELRPLFSDVRKINRNRSHKGELHVSSRAFEELTDIYEELYRQRGSKFITTEYLDTISGDDLALAVWFMDDGTTDFNRKRTSTTSLGADYSAF
jgi:hypothetical protein